MKKVLSAILAITMTLSAAVVSPAVRAEDDPVVTRFAVVSDIHTNPLSAAKTIDRLPKVFETAYAYAEEQGGTVDAFVFNGDSVDGNQAAKGYTNEQEWALFLEGVRDNVKSGSQVLLTLARTHDIYDGDGNNFYVQDTKLNALIKEYLGDNGSIIPTADWGYGPHLTMVGADGDNEGAAVITLSNDMDNGLADESDTDTDNDDNADNSYHSSEAWLDTTLSELVQENPARPIFVVFHYPEVGKLGWTQRWGQNSLRDTLNKYPQVITFNAHVHWDPRLSDAITQDRFTEIYDGAIRDICGPDATTVDGGKSPISSYSMVEVTKSGAVTVKYIDPDTGDLLKEANGSGELLEYSIPKAWDQSTWLYTDEMKFAADPATFSADASIRLENGNTLIFDRADSEHPILRYKVDVSNEKTTKTQYVFSELYNKELPANYSATLTLKTDVDYTITVTAIDGIYRESANTLTLSGKINDPDQVLYGGATAVTAKTYGSNGEKGDIDYPDFKTYATTPDAENITNWGISDTEDLKAWSAFSKSNSCIGLTFHLENDIDMKDQIFNMIGSLYVPFKGKFDGHLHTVSNLLIDDTTGMGTGFFVYTVDAEIKNFGIESGLVRGHVSNRKYENAGTYDAATKTFRTAFVDVIGVGAVAGRADNTDFSHIWNKANVTFRTGNTTAKSCFAGLVGRAQSASTFVGCYNTGNVTGLDRASGITNWGQNKDNAARISNCFNLGTITTENSVSTEAIARYNTVDDTDNAFFCFNNYYLEGSADLPTNRSSENGYTALGAEEPVALTSQEIRTELADRFNAKRAFGALIDDAEWDTDTDGNVFIASVGNNVSEKVITISSAAELNAFAASSKSNSYEDYTIVLQANVDLSETENFAMIGNTSYPFKGTFDGNGFTVSGMTVTAEGAQHLGLFRRSDGATIKNLYVKNFTVTNTATITAELMNYSSLLVGYSKSVTIENVHISDSSIIASMTGAACHDLGGFTTGSSSSTGGTIRNCSMNNCIVTSKTTKGGGQRIGGLVGGYATGMTIENCSVTNSSITAASRYGAILIGALRNTTVKNCFTYGNTVTSTYPGLAAGLLNRDSSISNCVFYESTANLCCDIGSYTLTALNNYGTKQDDTLITPVTEAQLNSGEIAYTAGLAMVNGYVAFPTGAAVAKRYTYVLDPETVEYRYTDSEGAVINGAPTVTAENFLGWDVNEDVKEGDLIYTAYYGTEDQGSYPISEFEDHPKATKFTISSAEELCTFATLSKSNTFQSYTVTMLKDIDLAGVAFDGIGSGSSRFMGTFDGGNHTVFNLTHTNQSGYFGFIRALEGTLKNLTIEDAVITVANKDASAIAVAWGYGTTTISNVKLRYSSLSQSGADGAGGFVGWLNKNGNYTLENCLVESCSISNDNQRVAALVANNAYNTTVKNCKVINTTVTGHRQVGLVCAFTTGLTVDGFIAYGNTLNCNYDSVGIIGRADKTANLSNVIAYNNSGKRNISGADTLTPQNSTEIRLFGRYESDAPTVTGSDLFTDVAADTTADPIAVTSVTTAQIKSGEAAYLMGFAMKYGNVTFPDADNKPAAKRTYVIEGTTVATLYTDGNGAVIGEAVEDPSKEEFLFCGWNETTDENGDKLLVAELRRLYDVNEDGTVDTADAVTLLRYIDGHPLPVHPAIADINGDGKIKVFDAVRLLQILRDL